MLSSLKTKSELETAAETIVSYVRDNVLDEEGILFAGFDDDGTPVMNQIIDDFGDVAPFMYLYGGNDICTHHLGYIAAHPESVDFNRAFASTDLILGLIWYAKVVNDTQKAALATDIAAKIADSVVNKWFSGPSFNSIQKYHFVLPVANGIDATYVEVWTELYRITNNQRYLDLAKKTFHFWRKRQIASQIKLIPIHSANIPIVGTVINRYGFKAHRVMKDNTNYGFGLLDLFRVNPEQEVKQAFVELHKALSVYAKKDQLSNVIEEGKPDDTELLTAFAFIDLSADAYQTFNESIYLETAITVADIWLDRQHPTTGLFPMFKNDASTYFDSETDMGVSLLKLYECTNDERYLKSAQRLLDGIMHYHLAQEYPLQVDVATGAVTTKNLKTKFVALAIKFLHLAQFPGQIYKNDELFMLAKDR